MSERAMTRRDEAAAPADTTRDGRPPDCDRARLLALQRTAGNAAVGALLRRPHPITVQRFSGFEHESLGDATGAVVDLGGGAVLTWGQIVAIAGDEYGSVEELKADVATAEGKARLRSRLEHDGVRGPIPAALPHEDPAKKSTSRFVELAMQNVSHFAAGGTALETWRSHHESALVSALQAGIFDNADAWQEAQLTEAFGQHYLTDSFSAGHVRTPRAEIMAWYQNDFAPRALGPFLAFMRRRVSEALAEDLRHQMAMPAPAVRAAVDAALAGILAALDGVIRDKFQALFGLGISGAISGTLHDQDNERGVWVASEAHPTPWLAYGDNKLGCSPVSREQAELAVITARERLVKARALGRTRREMNGVTPAPPGESGIPMVGAVPGVVHFGFNRSDLDPGTTAALNAAADYLLAHPEQHVDVVGHTDPIGTDNANDHLGMRRAETVVAYLQGRGVDPGRTTMASAGEHELVTATPSGFAANRRAELHFRAAGAPRPDFIWAQETLGTTFGTPPYREVERFVPREVPGLNDPQEEWRWGSLTTTMAAEVDGWVSRSVRDFKPGVLASPQLDDRTIVVPDIGIPPVPGAPPVQPRVVTLHPRPAVTALIDEVMARPTALIGEMVGEPAANRSTTPPPPPVPCVEPAAVP